MRKYALDVWVPWPAVGHDLRMQHAVAAAVTEVVVHHTFQRRQERRRTGATKAEGVLPVVAARLHTHRKVEVVLHGHAPAPFCDVHTGLHSGET